MDVWACDAVIIEHDKVRSIVPQQYDNFIQAVDRSGVSMDSYAMVRYMASDDSEYLDEYITEHVESEYEELSEEAQEALVEELTDAIGETYEKLCQGFKNVTGVTLYMIGISDESDYSNGEGCYFCVSYHDVYQVKPELKFLEPYITLEKWCEW